MGLTVVFQWQWFGIGDSYVGVNSSTDGRNCYVSMGSVGEQSTTTLLRQYIAHFAVILLYRGLRNVVFASCRYSSAQRRNFANKTGEWSGGAKSTVGVRNFNLESSEGGKRGKTGLNQFFYMHTPLFPILIHFFFYFGRFKPSRKPLFFCRKNVGRGYLPPCPPHKIYVYGWTYRHLCFQYVYILIYLFYELSALEVLVIWDKNLLKPNFLIF
jgi:hypothetical protein